MNAILYYGKGNCSIEGNVDYIKIKYRGAILIDSKLPSNYIISLGKNEIIIESQYLNNQHTSTHNTELYLQDGTKYDGYFHIHLIDNVVMTGNTHTEESQDLYYKNGKPTKNPISIPSHPYQLNDLFDYIGEFKILSVYAKNEQEEKVYITIKRVMDYVELLNTKSEDMTTKSEDLNAGYVHLIPVKETRIKGKIR